MSIDSEDIEWMTSTEIIELLDRKRRKTDALRKENKELESAFKSAVSKVTMASENIQIQEEKKTEVEDNDFEKEFEFYFSEFKKLKEHTKESIEEVLPPRNNYYYEKIIMRIIAEISRDIKGYREILLTFGSDMDKEELEEYRNEIVFNNAVRLILKDILFTEEKEVEVEHKNKLIFVPIKSTGKIRVFDELKDIPSEEYEGFIELFESIKDGTFKNSKRFYNNDNLKGALEVKGHQIRIVYQRLSKDCYAIVSIFMKKTQNNDGYRKAVEAKFTEFKTMEKELKESIKDPKFLEKHQKYEEELFEKLGASKDKGENK